MTHEEVDKLWDQFILKDNKKLEYWQFIRQIGYSKRSAAFENAKRAPPTRGDGDVLMTSKKLNSEKVLVRENVLHKVSQSHERLEHLES